MVFDFSLKDMNQWNKRLTKPSKGYGDHAPHTFRTLYTLTLYFIRHPKCSTKLQK